MKRLLFITLLIWLFTEFSYSANSCHVLLHNSEVTEYSQEITVVIGTDRKGSNSAVIAHEVLEQLALHPNTKINLVDLAELPPSIFRSDYFASKPAAFENNFVRPIKNASALIFVIPEYDGAVPGILSYYMNHMRASLSQKQVALVGLSAGRWGARAALDAFKGTLTHRGARVLGDLQINIEQVDTKVSQNSLTDMDSKTRIQQNLKELVRNLSRNEDSVNSQKSLALMAHALTNKKVKIQMNNQSSIEGRLSSTQINANQTLAYLQLSGPTEIKHSNQLIAGQGAQQHTEGYGFPVGAVKGLSKSWYKKDNLPLTQFIVGKKVKLEYESGVVVTGKIQNMSYNSNGDLTVISFTEATVKKDLLVLFQKSWGVFDLAVADYVEHISEDN